MICLKKTAFFIGLALSVAAHAEIDTKEIHTDVQGVGTEDIRYPVFHNKKIDAAIEAKVAEIRASLRECQAAADDTAANSLRIEPTTEMSIVQPDTVLILLNTTLTCLTSPNTTVKTPYDIAFNVVNGSEVDYF